ncbi:DUF4352 domain-containing protein [Aliibacillus thermotolerans]|uniref:DUF4352 domain-containing protein n=1 Tax=Aliibacillus thermotolerans TaxID=1834418 RepID=A0ABW0U4X4_9BACI|nr:DUF4352 domain-containing protein [Aliibacillus thermotolerans]
MDKKYWLLLALTLLLGFFSGMFFESQRSPNEHYQMVSADSTELLKIGETARVNQFDITVHESYMTEEEGIHYMIVDISFFNASEETQEIPLFNTLVVDEKGHSYEYEPGHRDQRLVGGQIRSQGLRRGTIAFAVEPSSHYELSYIDHSGNGLATWKLEADTIDRSESHE